MGVFGALVFFGSAVGFAAGSVGAGVAAAFFFFGFAVGSAGTGVAVAFFFFALAVGVGSSPKGFSSAPFV